MEAVLARTRTLSSTAWRAAWSTLLIGVCFTFTSETWIEWLYHLIDLAGTPSTDWYTLVGGYAFQALGIGAASWWWRHHQAPGENHTFTLATLLHLTCAIPAATSATLGTTLFFGYLMALCCGVIQAFYLTQLARRTCRTLQGAVFGAGYASSIALTWLLSLGRAAAGSTPVLGLLTCAVLSVFALVLVVIRPAPLAVDKASLPVA